MKKIIYLIFAVGLVLAASACSSSQKTGEGENANTEGQPAPAADAGTDAVPQATAENQAAPPPAGDAAAAQPPTAGGDTQQAQPSTQAAADTSTPPSPAGSGQFDSYTVQAGDTLMKIAFETYGDLYRWKGILDTNKDKITNPNMIPAGTVLKVEKPASPVTVEKNGEKYLIKTGDTLGTISSSVYGTTSKWKVLWQNNKQMIHDPNKIFAGFYLYYQPDGNTPKSDSPAVTPAPMAKTGGGGATTATTSGDSSRAPASNAPAGGTATQ